MFRSICLLLFLYAAGGLAIPLGLAQAGHPGSEARTMYFEGYELEDGALVFRGSRTVARRDGSVAETIVFQGLAGEEIQRMEAVYDAATLALISFSRFYPLTGAGHFMYRSGDQVRMTRLSGSKHFDTEALDWSDAMMVSSALVDRIGMERHALEAGEDVEFDLLLPSRLDSVGFRFRKAGDSEVNGRQVIVIEMEPTSWFLRLLIDPIRFYMDADSPHELLEYRGVTAILKKDGSHLDARIVYRSADSG